MKRACARVIDSGAFILGPEGRALETEFARVQGARFAVGVDSGTSALEIGLKALGVGPGDEVIVPAFTFIATATAVSAVGAKPVFADVSWDTLTLGPEEFEAAVTRRTKAVVPVHLYGQPADMPGLLKAARRKGVKVLEDCAQAHLTVCRGRPAGTWGELSAFSFYPSKNLGALGDAGAILTRNASLAALCAELRNAGRPAAEQYRHVRIGHNCRLDEIQAAMLRVKLPFLNKWVARRRAIALEYNQAFRDLPLLLPDPGRNGDRHAFHLYVIRAEHRDELALHLKKSAIGCGVYYPLALHLQPPYKTTRPPRLVHSEKACRTALALPLFPEMSPTQVKAVIKAVRGFFEH